MGGYLSFKSSGLLFPRLTEQHPFTRLPHAMRLRVFDEAHTETSKFLNWLHAVGEPKHGFCNKLRRVIRLNAFNVGLGSFASQRPTCFATERASDDSAWASRLDSAPRLSARTCVRGTSKCQSPLQSLKLASFWCGDDRAGFRAHGPFVSERPGYA